MSVELWSKANFDITHAFLLIVDGQLVGASFQGNLALQYGARVLKAVQVFAKVLVPVLENQFPHSIFSIRWQFNPILFGKINEGRDSQGTIQMNMQIGFGQSFYEGLVYFQVSL